MNDMPKDNNPPNYTEVLLEGMRGKIDGLVEAVSVVNDNVIDIKGRVERIETKTDLIPAMQAAIIEQTAQHNKLEQRVTHLEAA